MVFIASEDHEVDDACLKVFAKFSEALSNLFLEN